MTLLPGFREYLGPAAGFELEYTPVSRLSGRERKASRIQEEKGVEEPQKPTERPMNNGIVALVALWDFEAAVITFIPMWSLHSVQ